MKFNGNLRPGDELVIDTETGEVRQNNQEVYTYSGSLFSIYPNTTTITYTDNETSRDLNLSMEYQERNQ